MLIDTFVGFDGSQPIGIRVSADAITDNGIDELIVASGIGTAGHLRIFNVADNSILNELSPNNLAFFGGIYVSGLSR